MNLTFNNIKIKIHRKSNYLLYDNIEIVKPNVPKAFIASQNREIDNYNHPDYIDALNVYELEKSELIYNKIIDSIELIDKNVISDNNWKLFYKKITKTTEITKSEEFYFKKYFLINDSKLKNEIINHICLTESRVSRFFNMISIKKFGENIHEIDLKHTINTGIDYEHIQIGNDILVNPIDEWVACSESNLFWEKWLNNKYSLETMALTIALRRLNKLINLHSEDEQQTQLEKKK